MNADSVIGLVVRQGIAIVVRMRIIGADQVAEYSTIMSQTATTFYEPANQVRDHTQIRPPVR